MSWSTFFIQECPTCGRKLQVRVRDLGRGVTCQHCCARFVARDSHNDSAAMDDPIDALLDRAEDFLVQADVDVRKPK